MHPILVNIPTPWGAIPIYSYGVMLGTSLIFAWYFVMYWGRKIENFDEEFLANAFVFTAICSILGARLLYVLTNLDDFEAEPMRMLQFRSGGLVAYGGFLGGAVSGYVYTKWKKVPYGAFADLVAPTLGSGLFFTRIGCWLYGCDFGKPLSEGAPDLLVRVGTFPRWESDAHPALACDQVISGSPAYNHHMVNYPELMEPGALASLPVHPTQIYESLAGLVLFGVTYWAMRHRQFRGQAFLVIAMLYSLWRFTVEFWRDDPERGAALGFSTSQLISLAVLPVCVVFWIWLKKRVADVGEAPIPASAQFSAPSDPETPKQSKKKNKKKG